MFVRRRRINKPAAIMAVPSVFFLLLSIFGFSSPVQADSFPDAGFEDGTFTGWSKGSQSGTLGSTITGNGSGVTIFTGSRTFTHGSRGAVGSPSSEYYAPAVASGSWTFSPNNGTNAVLLQPKGEQTFDQASSALSLSAGSVTEIKNMLTSQAQASGNGQGTPTDAAWITREVQLTAGTTYTMAWNYVGTDYVPYNDGSITSLIPVTVTGTPVVTVNNYVKQYALLGFTNPGTGDYSTNSYGSTGWQTSTYQVSISGTYKLGFASFNLDDSGLPPALMIDSEAGSTNRCISNNCAAFGGVASNSETAPTVPPTTTTTVAQTTTTSSTTTTSTTTTTTTTTTIPAPTSLEVTSLLDDGSSGTLRWAITQANATAGGIYDAITFDINGTITLTSALPQITQNLTVTGNGRTQTIIDGNNLYRPFNIAGTKSLTISNMTLKQGQATNGGLIFNGSGTLSATNIRFTGMSGGSAVFNNNNGSVSTLTNTTFDYLNIGIAGDYGSTPSALSLTDSDYTNRTYVYDSVFSNNYYGIYGQRFVKINNTQFSNNTYGALLAGLNRQQVTNSVFTSNGTGVYFSSWIPTSWTVGAGNQMVSGNTFNGNTTAILFANNWNNGSSVYNGVSSNSFSTASGNTFGTTAQNTNNFSGSGYVESNNTITAAYLNPVTNLTAVANADGSVDLDWDASAASNCVIYGYSVSFYDLTVIGGATSGGWGVWTNQGTNYSLSTGMFSGSNPVTTGYGPVRFGIKAMTGGCAGVGTGSCTYGPEVTIDATVLDPTPVTTTTSTTVAPVVVIPPGDTTVPLPQLPEPETESTTVTLPEGTEPETALPEIVIPPVGTEPETVVVIIPSDEVTLPEAGEAISTGDLEDILDTTFTPDASTEEITAVLDGLLDAKLTGKQFDAVVDATLGSLEEPGADVGAVVDSFLEADLTDKEFTKVLDAVFSEDVSDEVFTEALTTMIDADLSDKEFDKVLDAAFSETTSPEAIVSALSSIFDGPASGGDISKVMGAVFDEDISAADTMTVLGDLLETNLSASEAEAVFDSVFDSDLSDAETIDLIVDVLKDGLTAELLGSVLGAVFDAEVSTEVLIETFTAVLDGELNAESIRVIVDVLESDTITSEQVGQVVTLVIEQEGGIESGQATELATSAKVLESIDGEQASAVFNAIVVSEVSEEAGAAISEALTEAPTDVKESFEEEINVFAGVFDTYEPLGSTINVGQRRSVIAVNLVTSTVALAAAAGAIPTPGSSPSAPRQDVAVRKEEEQEEGGAIEGEGPDWVKRISIYKYEDGVRVMDWKNFTRKFVYGILASGFTLAGATVMYFTLSGLTQQIALWGTILAFTGSMYLHMKEPDSE
jgi:hypothetical protein